MKHDPDKYSQPTPDESGNAEVQSGSLSSEGVEGEHLPADSAAKKLNLPNSYGGIVERNRDVLGEGAHADFVNVLLFERERVINKLEADLLAKERAISVLTKENTDLKVEGQGLRVKVQVLEGVGLRKSLLATVGTGLLSIGIGLLTQDSPVATYSLGFGGVGALCLFFGWFDVKVGGKK